MPPDESYSMKTADMLQTEILIEELSKSFSLFAY